MKIIEGKEYLTIYEVMAVLGYKTRSSIFALERRGILPVRYKDMVSGRTFWPKEDVEKVRRIK